MKYYRRALVRTVRSEWHHGYLSARRDSYTRRRAARMWLRELWAGLVDLPNYAAELRAYHP